MSLKVQQTLWEHSVETKRESPIVMVPESLPNNGPLPFKDAHCDRPGTFWECYKASFTPAGTISSWELNYTERYTEQLISDQPFMTECAVGHSCEGEIHINTQEQVMHC